MKSRGRALKSTSAVKGAGLWEGNTKRAISAGAIAFTLLISYGLVREAAAQEKDGWKGVARTFLWNPGPIQFTETSKFKKNGPWTIAVSNASISNV